jgi:hypothetical protein
MPRALYLEREAAVRACLDRVIPGHYRIPRHYGDKADFGDMDVIVAEGVDWDVARGAIVAELGITETRTVGHVFSTVFDGLQTDFFRVPARYLESTYTFMCWNDLGNFLGRIVRRFDLKYGERGLVYVYRRADGKYRRDLEVTLDFARICDFLELDHAAWVAGFPTLEAMFDWVIASPYFSVAPYLDETRGDLRHRAEVRPTVARFIAYLDQHAIDRRPTFEDRRDYLPKVLAAFPEARLELQLAAEREAEARQRTLASKLDGKRVMRLVPGLKGKALGALLQRVRSSVDDFDAWVLATEQSEIDRRVLELARESSREP